MQFWADLFLYLSIAAFSIGLICGAVWLLLLARAGKGRG